MSALGAALCCSGIQAAGFGELTLHSRIGEPLHVEIPVLTNPGENLESACFSLESVKNADLPVVATGRTRLLKDGDQYRLSIIGGPVSEPLFMISVRASCGVDLQRRFTLMPDAPVETARSFAPSEPVEPALSLPPVSPKNTAKASPPPHKPREAREATKPRPRPTPAAPRRTQPTPPPPSPSVPSEPPAPAAPPKAPEAPRADRLVLGAPTDAPANGKPPSESELRIRQLENSLSLLNEEVDRLNKALALTAETLSAQQKLQAAQAALQALPGNAPPAATVNREARNQWLELLLSALIGGGLAAALARLFARRATRDPSGELPLSMAAASAPTRPVTGNGTVDRTGAVQSSALADEKSSATNSPSAPSNLSDFSLGSADTGFSFSEGESIIELAEIMISFGRVRGAAETLAQYIDTHSPANIQPWLMLLDLYRRGDQHAEFDALGQKLAQRFNISAPAWGETQGHTALEQYPHILEQLCRAWGTPACVDYLYDLVQGRREGQRDGFPLAVVEEIVLLIRLLEVGHGLHRHEA